MFYIYMKYVGPFKGISVQQHKPFSADCSGGNWLETGVSEWL